MQDGRWLGSVAFGLIGVLSSTGLLVFVWGAGQVASALRDGAEDAQVAGVMIVMAVVFAGSTAVFAAVALRHAVIARALAIMTFGIFLVLALALAPEALREFWGWGWAWMPVVVAVCSPLVAAALVTGAPRHEQASVAGTEASRLR